MNVFFSLALLLLLDFRCDAPFRFLFSVLLSMEQIVFAVQIASVYEPNKQLYFICRPRNDEDSGSLKQSRPHRVFLIARLADRSKRIKCLPLASRSKLNQRIGNYLSANTRNFYLQSPRSC